MVTTKHAQSGGRGQATAQSNAPFQQDNDDSSSSDDDIPAEPTPNYKRNRSMFTGPTLRPMKRVRNSLEYIPPSKRRKTPESIVVAGDQEQSLEAEGSQQDGDLGEDEDEDTPLNKQLFKVVNSFTQSRDPPLPPTEPQQEPQPSATGVKRRRGRPRKHPLPVIAQDQPAFETQLSQRALDEIKALAEETLGSVEVQTQERDQVLDSVEVEYHTAYEALEPAEHPESQLLRGVDDNVDDERQQEEEVEQEEEQQAKESLQNDKDTLEIGATPIPEQPEQEPDNDSDEEFPSLFDLKKRTKKQVPPSAQPELGPEHTRPSPVLGSDPADEFANGDDYQDQEDDYEERENDKEWVPDEEQEQSQEDEEEQTDKEDEANNQPPRAPPNRRATPPEDSLLFQAPESVNDSHQVEMSGSTIMPLRDVMGRPGWTGLSKDWAKIIIQPYRDQTRKPMATQVVKDFCGQLYDLKILFDRAPRAASLIKQNEYLRGVQKGINKSIKTLQDIVAKGCEQHLAPNGVTEPHYRQSLRQDLFEYGIPMLILVLSSAYFLGEMDGGDDNIDEVGYDFPDFPQFGIFTTSTIQYLLRITGWIKRLETRLVSEVSDDEDAEDEHLGNVGRFKTNVLKRKIAQNRQLLKKHLGPWEETLQQALSDVDDQAEQRAESLARDEAIKRARQAAEEAELAKREAQYTAFALSTQRIASLPPPRVEQWQKTTRSMVMPRSSGAVTPVTSVPTRHQQQPGSLLAEKLARDEAIKRDRQAAEEAELAKKEAQLARDEAIKKARQEAEEVELAKKEAQYAAFALSTQRLRSLPSPRVEQWQKTTRSMVMPRSSGAVIPVTSVPTSHQQQPGSLVSATSSKQSRVSNTGSTHSSQQRSDKPNYPKWSGEKRIWLLTQLQKTGPRVSNMEYEDWADALRKPITEVWYEAETYRVASRSLAERRGTKVERWAMEG